MLKKMMKSLMMSQQNKKPSFFRGTKYRDPSDEELREINESNVNSNELLQGLGYAIIGRGIERQKEKDMIINAIERLLSLQPDNEQYKIALKEAKKTNKSSCVKIADEILKEAILPDQPGQTTKEISTEVSFGLSAESLRILLETIRQVEGFSSMKEKLPANFSSNPPIITFTVGINPALKITSTQFENNLKNEIKNKRFRFELIR